MKIVRNLLIAAALIIAGNMCAMNPLLVEFVKKEVDTTIFTEMLTDKKGEFLFIRGESEDGLRYYQYYALQNGSYKKLDDADDVEKIGTFIILEVDKLNFYDLTKFNNGQPAEFDKPVEEDDVPQQGLLFDRIKNMFVTAGELFNIPARYLCQVVADTKMGQKIGDNERRATIVTVVSRGITTVGVASLMVYAAWKLTHTSSQEDDDEDADLDVPIVAPDAKTHDPKVETN